MFSMSSSLPSVVMLLASLLQLVFASSPSEERCRCFPGDACWPSAQDWSAFNSSLGGKLVPTIPLAAPCHESEFGTYNATACEILQTEWTLPEAHYNSSSSIMAPFFANRSCDPFTSKDAHCIIGAYVDYAVNVSSAKDVQRTLAFAQKKNVRIVIRNTGHDYSGKSSGAGSLAIWTHHLKDIEIFDYNSKYYKGKAMKMGAGVQGFEAYQAAHDRKLVVVGGECPTVGLAGGYTQGGGHSALGSKYGLAADQVLKWELVDGRGRHITATRSERPDIFWALSGGGGGTYGVVLSMTVKAHVDMPTSGANITFTSEGLSQDVFWQAIGAYHASLPKIVDQGIMGVSYYTNETFTVSPLTAPGVSSERLEELLGPFVTQLDDLDIKYTKFVTQFPNYLEEFNTMFSVDLQPIRVGIAQYGGRLVPRATVTENNGALTEAYRRIADKGATIIIVGINASKKVSGDVDNSVNPIWRDTLLDTVVTTPWNFTAPWSEMVASADLMTNELIPILEEITPDGGTYVNEADFQDPNWKNNYYGSNYDRLLHIKNKYDPHHMFYALTAVGSDYWKQQLDGRLCRADE